MKNKKVKIGTIMEIVENILFWIIYLLVWRFAGLLIAVIVAISVVIYGFINYKRGGDYVERLYGHSFTSLSKEG
jgi:predicted membrane protein